MKTYIITNLLQNIGRQEQTYTKQYEQQPYHSEDLVGLSE